MKVCLLLGLVAIVRANVFSDIGHALSGAVDTVGDGVKDAANTVAHGVVDAAGTVGDGVMDAAHAISGIGGTLDSTFGDVWNVVKDPLEAEGKQLLVEAGTLLLEESLKAALDMMAAGRRDVSHNPEDIKAYLTFELLDEYQKWLQDTKAQILGSKDELAAALKTSDISQLPTQLASYMAEYGHAVLHQTTDQFIVNQASTAFKHALTALDTRVHDRVTTAVQTLLVNVNN